MKPFLLIQSRPEDEASDSEYKGFLKSTKLQSSQLHRLRAEKQSIGNIQLELYSGIFFGGGPFNVSDVDSSKSVVQKRVESEIFDLLGRLIEQDFPVFGVCYGVGLITAFLGGVVSSTYGEYMDVVDISLADRAQDDDILLGIGNSFKAIVGHNEACEVMPSGAVLLASSVWCPVQMFRVKQNIYASQFHPEVDGEGLEVKVRVYSNHGYFGEDEAETIIANGYAHNFDNANQILFNFVQKYSRSV